VRTKLFREIFEIVAALLQYIPKEQFSTEDRSKLKDKEADLSDRLNKAMKLLEIKDNRVRELQERNKKYADMVYDQMATVKRTNGTIIIGPRIVMDVEVITHYCEDPDCQRYRERSARACESWIEAAARKREAYEELREHVRKYKERMEEEEKQHEDFVRIQTAVLLGEEWQCPFCKCPQKLPPRSANTNPDDMNPNNIPNNANPNDDDTKPDNVSPINDDMNPNNVNPADTNSSGANANQNYAKLDSSEANGNNRNPHGANMKLLSFEKDSNCYCQ